MTANYVKAEILKKIKKISKTFKFKIKTKPKPEQKTLINKEKILVSLVG